MRTQVGFDLVAIAWISTNHSLSALFTCHQPGEHALVAGDLCRLQKVFREPGLSFPWLRVILSLSQDGSVPRGAPDTADQEEIMGNSKKILITGASAGFGFNATKALAERGHTVYATMRDMEGKNAGKAKALTDWAKQGGHDVHVLELDVTKESSVNRAVAQAVENGGIDVLINNAGVGVMGLQEAFTLDQVEKLFEVNVFGVLRTNRSVLPHFRKNGAGRIVYISSGLGRLVLPFLGPYTATKFAIEALAQTASYELEPLGIRSVIVQPGAYGTTFMQNSIMAGDDQRTGEYGPMLGRMEAFGKGFEERAKAGQIGDPREVVNALVEVVEAADSDLPSRRPVGADISEPVSALNQLSEQIHDRIYKAFGLS
jgi:NAD(P)-dependent dehydrogenase (short-subunit alcohol dehydrogenase family)